MKTLLNISITAVLALTYSNTSFAGNNNNTVDNTENKPAISTSYYENGAVKSNINIATGEYTYFYPAGELMEQGVWNNGKHIGLFVRYYENGNKHQQFYFNERGHREGAQFYYFENGTLMLEGEWTNGKKHGMLTRYAYDGEVKEVLSFNDGKIVSPSKDETFSCVE